MDPLLVYYLVVSLSFLSAFVTTLRFYIVRMGGMAAEQRVDLRPILVISGSFLVGLFATVLKLISLGSPSAEMLLVVDLASPLFGFTMFVAVVLALRRPRLIVVGLVFLAVSLGISLISPHPIPEPTRAIWVFASNFILVIPALLFGYLWLVTKRPNAFGLLVGISLYLGYTDMMTIHPIEYGFVAALLVTLGWAFTSFSFLYYDRRLGGEIIGYSFSITVVAGATAALLILADVIPFDDFLFLFFVACSAAVALLTGSYLYGRYREKPFRQSLALSLSMLMAGVGWVMSDIYYVSALVLPSWFRVAQLTVGLISTGFLFVSAIYALDLGKLVFIPALFVVLFAVLAFFFGASEPWVLTTMIASALVMTVLPVVMFAVLWRRIRVAKEKDAGKPLGISVGYTLIAISSMFAFIPELICGPLRLIGTAIIFLGISGRIDKWIYSRKS